MNYLLLILHRRTGGSALQVSGQRGDREAFQYRRTEGRRRRRAVCDEGMATSASSVCSLGAGRNIEHIPSTPKWPSTDGLVGSRDPERGAAPPPVRGRGRNRRGPWGRGGCRRTRHGER